MASRMLAVRAAKAAKAKARAAANTITCSVSKLIRPVGGQLQQRLAQHLQQSGVKQDSVSQLVEFCLGALPRGATPMQAEARLLERSRQRTGVDIDTLAACVHISARLFVSSILSHILVLIEKQEVTPLATIRYYSQDETSMVLRVSNIGHHSGAQGAPPAIADLMYVVDELSPA